MPCGSEPLVLRPYPEARQRVRSWALRDPVQIHRDPGRHTASLVQWDDQEHLLGAHPGRRWASLRGCPVGSSPAVPASSLTRSLREGSTTSPYVASAKAATTGDCLLLQLYSYSLRIGYIHAPKQPPVILLHFCACSSGLAPALSLSWSLASFPTRRSQQFAALLCRLG